MARTLQAALGWVEIGGKLVHESLADLTEEAFDAPTALPGWTRRHLTAHLAANEEAVGNLIHWAATGVPTPMYASPQRRAGDIEEGSARTGADLRGWFDSSADQLVTAMAALDAPQWAVEVQTAQGRVVPASETPWMRARELLVHAVDLNAGPTFQDLPTDFLQALGDDIAAQRSAAMSGPALILQPADHTRPWTVEGTGTPTAVTGSLADVVAYLAGRESAVTGTTGTAAPQLPAWL